MTLRNRNGTLSVPRLQTIQKMYSTKKTERRGDMVGGAKPSGQINCLDSLQPGNRNSTIPVSQSHPFFFCNVPSMSKKNPDHVDSAKS
jgi:hypothetical protein